MPYLSVALSAAVSISSIIGGDALVTLCHVHERLRGLSLTRMIDESTAAGRRMFWSRVSPITMYCTVVVERAVSLGAAQPHSPQPSPWLQLNLTGAGLTETLKATWRTPKKEEDSGKDGAAEPTA